MSRILMVAYACEPAQGSESGVGWNWARMAAEAGHDVTVVTREANRAAIELEGGGLSTLLHFEYLELPRAVLWAKRRFRWTRVYYLAWCLAARRRVRLLLARAQYDLVHHVTWATAMMPSPLARLNMPFVLGPVGGGVTTPWSAWRLFGLRGTAYEALRSASLLLARRNPALRRTWRDATIAIAQNADTARLMERGGAGQVVIYPNAGIEPSLLEMTGRQEPQDPTPERGVKCVFAARLVHWKGAAIAVRALALTPGISGTTLDVYGDGPERSRLERLARRLGISGRVAFHGPVPRAEVLDALRHADYFLLPSLHDEGPLGIPEAMACGAVVIAADRGGPVVSAGDAAVLIPVGGVSGMAKRIADVISRPPTDDHRRASMERASDFVWDAKTKTVAEIYSLARDEALLTQGSEKPE